MTGVLIHLDHAGMRAEGEAEVGRIVEARRLEARLEAIGILVRHVGGEGDLAEGDLLVGRAFHHELACDIFHVLGVRFEQMRGDQLALLFDLVHGHDERGAAHGGRAAAVGAHAEGHDPRVAVDDLHVVHWDAEMVAHELGECRLVALTM